MEPGHWLLYKEIEEKKYWRHYYKYYLMYTLLPNMRVFNLKTKPH